MHTHTRTVEGGFIFSYRCPVFPKKCSRRKKEYFGVIQVKRLKNVFLSIFSQPNFTYPKTLFDPNDRVTYHSKDHAKAYAYFFP